MSPDGGFRKSVPRWTVRSRRALFLLLMSVLCLGVSRATVRCPDPAGPGCFCEYRKGDNERGGWELSCHNDQENFEATYRLDYAIRSFARLECFLEAPYRRGFFAEYNVTDVDYFQFITCPLPSNLTLGEVMEGMTVKKLKFEGDKPGLILAADVFRDLLGLGSLNLHKNQLTSVPEDLFQNMTKLQSIELNENNLNAVPEQLFTGLENLMNLQLGSNELETIPAKIFSGLGQLQRLYLYKNRLKELPAGLFLGTKALKVLDLANNQIQELHAELFLDTPKIMHINIRGNNLTRLQSDLFQGTKHLEELDISDNKFTKLPENLLEGLGALKSVSLNNCNLKGIGETFFSSTVNLTKIEMWNNRLSSLPPGLFGKNTALKELSLHYNDLLELPATVFQNNYNLNILKLTHNNLTSLPTGIFDQLASLEYLDLTANSIKALSSSLLVHNQKLTELYAAKNKIAALEGSLPFGQSSKLKIVDLSYNEVTALPYWINWGVYLNLQKLNFKNNNLTALSVPDIYMFGSGTEVELQDNQIRSVDVRNIKIFEADQGQRPITKMRVYLEGNPLECDCHLHSFLIYASHNDYRKSRAVEFSDLDNLECGGPSELSGNKLNEVPQQDFTCPLVEGCPNNCECFDRAVDKSKVVRCTNATALPPTLPEDAREVHLENNQIKSLHSLGEYIWQNVTRLYLDNNNVTQGDWVLPNNLRVLSLKGNLLEFLPESLMEYVESRNEIQIYLGDNPWECDCDTLQLKDWLYENVKKVMDINEMYCSRPIYQNGTEVRVTVGRLTEEICPEVNVVNNTHLITVSVICVILAVLLFIVSVLYYRNKQTVIAYFYIHFYNVFVCFFSDDDLDEDKTFDAFVSYSSEDRDLAMELVSQLEHGDPAFKLCIHERDWLPGNLISWNIVNSVQNSRKTILVLSKHFLESVWFQVEFHTAYYQMLEDRIDRLIVIVRGDLPEKSALDKDLQCLLSTKTFLEWGERWFWEKLRYALPHRRGTNDSVAPKNSLRDKSFPLRQRPNPGLLKTVENKLASLSGENDKAKPTEKSEGEEVDKVEVNMPRVNMTRVNSKKAQSKRFNSNRVSNVQNGNIEVIAV